MPADARPSLLAGPVMGLTADRSGVGALVGAHRHVYFSDLRGLAEPLPPGRLLYGCFVDRAAGAQLVCCAGAGEPPADPEVRRAIADGERGDWSHAWALLRQPTAIASAAVEHLVAIAALGTLDPRVEVRLSAMTLVARLVREHPALLPADAREVACAFLLYRAADPSDLLWHDAVALIDQLALPPRIVEHVVGRGRSSDPRERIDALVARDRMYYLESMVAPYPPVAQLLDDDDPDVQVALLQMLRHVARYPSDLDDLLPGVDVPAKLDRFLRSRDERVRGEAIRYARGVGGPANGPALRAALTDPDPALRDAALDALYGILPPDELRALLVHHEPSDSQRAMLQRTESHRRASGVPSQIGSTAELRAMLSSSDPRQRHEALLLAGYTGDPALVPEVEAATRDPDPRVRAEADRLRSRLA